MIWVRNVPVDTLDRVKSCNFGSEHWEEAYAEMISKGYVFELGYEKGHPNGVYMRGLYLTNPLDINIEKSTFDVVNRLNEKIKQEQERIQNKGTPQNQDQETQDQDTSEDLSLIVLLEKLEKKYHRATEFRNSPAYLMAPEGAMDHFIKEQERAYDDLVEKLKQSKLPEIMEFLKAALDSKYLTKTVKVALLKEEINPIEEFIQNKGTPQNQDQDTSEKKLNGGKKIDDDDYTR